ncbi:MAG: DUF2018 family protein [Campylobacter sp.]|nr:DUF2018 family protein [Campylobacter sp.]
MDIFEGTPRDKFFDIAFNANRNLVEDEITKLLMKLISYEEICAKHGISESEVAMHADEKLDFTDELNDKFIELKANILSANE